MSIEFLVDSVPGEMFLTFLSLEANSEAMCEGRTAASNKVKKVSPDTNNQ